MIYEVKHVDGVVLDDGTPQRSDLEAEFERCAMIEQNLRSLLVAAATLELAARGGKKDA